jgi:hypothetical protein
VSGVVHVHKTALPLSNENGQGQASIILGSGFWIFYLETHFPNRTLAPALTGLIALGTSAAAVPITGGGYDGDGFAFFDKLGLGLGLLLSPKSELI